MTSVMWFRRDLRLADNPALLEAVADAAGPIVDHSEERRESLERWERIRR